MPNNTPSPAYEIWLNLKTFFTSPIVIAIISYIAGFGTAYVKNWVQWIFKKKEIELTNQYNSRKENITRWRNELGKHTKFITFSTTPTFYELKDKINPVELKGYFNPTVIDNPFAGTERHKLEKFYKVISDQEKEWGIT